MLARKNQHGEVLSSIPGLAHVARVTVEQCEDALRRFQQPDKYSRTPDHGGCRIEVIPGGWYVLNHDKYRRLDDEDDRRAKTAERVRRFRERNPHPPKAALHSVTRNAVKRPVTHVTRSNAQKRHTDADADADATTPTWLTPFLEIWEQVYGVGSGAAVAGRLATAVRPLVKAHGAAKVATQLRHYVTQVEPEFANPQGFAQKFAAWKGTRRSRQDATAAPPPQAHVDPLVSEAVDRAAAARPSKRLQPPLVDGVAPVKRKT